MENREFVTQQDNTRVNNYQTNRPEASKRLFVSQEVERQIDHIKPKAGTNGRPDLCFDYHNYAHSCINPKTCGQKKQNGLLPIEPGPGCNAEWVLSTDGTIEPLPELTRRRRHDVIQTRDMLGLQDANLVDERRRWFASAITILKQAPDDFSEFLQHAPYRHILATAF